MPKIQTNLDAPFQRLQAACRITGFSVSYLRARCKENSIPYCKAGNTYLINIPKFLEQMNRESEAGKA